MSTLHIDLQNGFRGHSAKVSVNGEEVYNHEGLTTGLTVSRADGFEVQTGDDTATVDVVIDPGGVRGSTTINTAENAYLSISLDGNQVRFGASAEPFRYM